MRAPTANPVRFFLCCVLYPQPLEIVFLSPSLSHSPTSSLSPKVSLAPSFKILQHQERTEEPKVM